MNYKDKRVTIFGLGKSGIAVVKKLHALGALVTATDQSTPQDVENLRKPGVNLELGGHTLKAIEGADLIIVSPGVHLDLPVLKEARKRNIPIISEIELAYQFITKPIIAVTGTNGKTTTTTLIGEILRAAGKRVAVAGNIGTPLIEVDDSGLDYIVAEISSYQLEAVDKFKPWISVILNIQPDHLERHHSLAEYINQKTRIFTRQTGADFVVYNQDDPLVVGMVEKAACRKAAFSKQNTAQIITIRPEEIKIPGRHNLDNALAAATVANLCGIDKTITAVVLKTFSGVEHRIEFVTKINNVEFYNDSKATNPDSTLVALETFAGRSIVLILGGKDKGVGLEALSQAVKNKVKEVVLIGEAAPRLAAALNGKTQRASSFEEAVNLAYQLAAPGDLVLLSPACASFDMFANYEERGKTFKQLCRNLKT